jgi:hypothetical protein
VYLDHAKGARSAVPISTDRNARSSLRAQNWKCAVRAAAAKSIVATICLLAAGFVGEQRVLAVPACARWSVSGTWTTHQSNLTEPVTFKFDQSGTSLKGTAVVGKVSENFLGKLTGSVETDKLVAVVTWNQVASDGRVLKGRYVGTLSRGHIKGSTTSLTGAPATARWYGTGPGVCES